MRDDGTCPGMAPPIQNACLGETGLIAYAPFDERTARQVFGMPMLARLAMLAPIIYLHVDLSPE